MQLSSKYRLAKDDEPAYLTKSDDEQSYLLTQEEVDFFIIGLKKSLEFDDRLMESCGVNEFRYKIEEIDLNNITAEDIIRANLTKEETKRLKDYLKQSKKLNDMLFIQNRKMREIGSKINKVRRSGMVNELYNTAQFDLLREELLHLKNPDIDTSERYEKKVIYREIFMRGNLF